MDAESFATLLSGCANGDRRAEEQLFEQVYGELRRMASHFLRNEDRRQAMNTSTLVHETYLRMLGGERSNMPNRSYFFGAAAQAMRRILVDHARARSTKKRSPPGRFDFEPGDTILPPVSGDLLDLDQALDSLAGFDANKAKVVELLFFGGLSIPETALVLEISERTVKRHWAIARAWLRSELEK
ncbi:MAG: sigma-70 family RNA polymerase sigma factor [Acidobacteria bacterium]|nr:sigma-70 family RNA polymerase sigma factor [Acidobacteriota bacterium]